MCEDNNAAQHQQQVPNKRASVVARVFYNCRGPRGRKPLAVPLHTDVVKGDVVVGRVPSRCYNSTLMDARHVLRALGDFFENKVRNCVVFVNAVQVLLYFDGGDNRPTVAAAVENVVSGTRLLKSIA